MIIHAATGLKNNSDIKIYTIRLLNQAVIENLGKAFASNKTQVVSNVSMLQLRLKIIIEKFLKLSIFLSLGFVILQV